jgi:hypothetical protein
MSQAPQCRGSLSVLTHAPSQISAGATQLNVQTPLVQAAEPFAASGHARPHAPQLLVSVVTSTQLVPHGVKGLLHTKWQLLSTHTPVALGGALQIAPQPPQFFGSRLGFAQLLAHCVSVALHPSGFPEPSSPPPASPPPASPSPPSPSPSPSPVGP